MYMKMATGGRVRPYFVKLFPWIKNVLCFRSELASINVMFVRSKLHPILWDTKRKPVFGITNDYTELVVWHTFTFVRMR